MKKAKLTIFILLLMIALSFSSCNDNMDLLTEKDFFAMNTMVNLKLFGSNSQKAVEQIETEIANIEKRISVKIPDSEIGRINSSPAGQAIKISDNTLGELQESFKISEKSGGLFDPSVFPLVQLWDITGGSNRIPQKEEIEFNLLNIGRENFEINGNLITKKIDAASLDFSSIGKGIACNTAGDILLENGIDNALISVGGSIYVKGINRGKNQNWKIGIRNPRGEANSTLGYLTVTDAFISTSGDYERFFEAGGIRYHHIINPKTGFPANNQIISATIVSKDGLVSDALSTACFILGIEESEKLLKEYSSEAIFVTADKAVYITSDLFDYFQFSDPTGEFDFKGRIYSGGFR